MTSALKPFVFHGVAISRDTGEESVADCRFCLKEDHFHINNNTGQWSCKSCGASGNAGTFLLQLSEYLNANTTKDDWLSLAKSRLIPISGLKAWRIGYDPLMRRWTFPVISPSLKSLVDLRVTTAKGRVISTAGSKVGIFGGWILHDNDSRGMPIFICEGEWDAMSLAWLVKKLGKKYQIISVPGAGVFKKEWVELFAGRDVIFAYDNDGAGDEGSAKAGCLIEGVAESVRYVCWPPSLPEGWDVRDLISTYAVKNKNAERAWDELMDIVRDEHRDAVLMDRVRGVVSKDPTVKSANPMASVYLDRSKRSKILKGGSVKTFSRLHRLWERWIKMDTGLSETLRVILATVLTTDIPGDPLWIYIVGEPGSGKTTLLSALRGTNETWFESSLSPHVLISGWKSTEDPSLLPKLTGKCLVVKDATEMLSLPITVQQEIYSVLRGAYDGYGNRSFGNTVSRHYDNIHFNLVAGVTDRIHGVNQSTLGERFLKYQIVTRPDGVDDVKSMFSLLNAVERTMGKEVKIDRFLRAATTDFIENIGHLVPKSVEGKKVIRDKVKAMAILAVRLRSQIQRSRSGDLIAPTPMGGSDSPTRVYKQLTKLGVGLDIIMGGKGRLRERDFPTLRRVAMDTAFGFQSVVFRSIIEGSKTRDSIVQSTGWPDTNIRRALDDMVLIGVVKKSVLRRIGSAGRPLYSYSVAKEFMDLWEMTK